MYSGLLAEERHNAQLTIVGTGVVFAVSVQEASVISSLRESMLPTTFTAFLADTCLEVEGSTAFIKTANTFAHGWIENRMKDKLLKLLNVELHDKSVQLTELQCIS